MPKKKKNTRSKQEKPYTALQLSIASGRLKTAAEKLAAVAKGLEDLGVPTIDISNFATLDFHSKEAERMARTAATAFEAVDTRKKEEALLRSAQDATPPPSDGTSKP